MDVQCGLLWTGEAWQLVTMAQYGDLTALNASPEITDLQLQALRSSAHHTLAHFLAAVGDDDALRMWVEALSEEQKGRLRYVLARHR